MTIVSITMDGKGGIVPHITYFSLWYYPLSTLCSISRMTSCSVTVSCLISKKCVLECNIGVQLYTLSYEGSPVAVGEYTCLLKKVRMHQTKH